MHGVMCIGKRVNAKIRNYDLRDLDIEMNGSVHGCKSISNWHVHC